MKNLIGTTIGQHEIVEQLGRGGMANVYKAFHPGLAVYRAIKVIRPDLADTEGFRDRFQREARAVAGLRHPNVVQIHDFGQHEDLFYMVMEFVEGEDLKTKMLRQGAIRPFAEAVRIIEQVGEGLGYAHGRGVVHRDVKPDNVLLDESGRAILADFGIAKMIGADDAKLTATGTGLGTPAYMAPEQAKGSVDVGAAADLYALGVVLYEMLTAHLPFSADTPLAVLQRVIYDPVPPPREFTADIPDALQGVVLKAMAKDPAQRYPSAEAMVEAAKQSLAGITAEPPAVADPAAVPPPPPPSSSAPQGAATTDGGTVILDETGTPVPATPTPAMQEGGREQREAAGSPRSSRGPLLAAIVVIVLALLLAVGAVGAGVWWFGFRDRGEEAETMAEAGSDALAAAAVSDAEDNPLGIGDPLGPVATASPEDDPEDATAAANVGGEIEREGPGDGQESEATGIGADGAGAGSQPASSEAPVASEGGSPGTPSRRQTAEPSTATQEQAEESPEEAGTTGASPAGGARTSTDEESWRSRRPSAQAASPAAASGARFLGRVRFGSSLAGEVEPEQPVEAELEIERPSTFYFDIVRADRVATYVLHGPDGAELFRQKGADFGPLRVEEEGIYTLTVETDGGLPVQFEIRFVLVGA